MTTPIETALREELAEAKAELDQLKVRYENRSLGFDAVARERNDARARVGELEGALREIQNEGAHTQSLTCVRSAQLRCGHCNEWCEPACPSCGHELLEHVPSTAAPVPPESVRAEAPAPREPVMCSCGREFDTPQALWDHYVKDGASDEERESHGATTPAPREPCCDLASRGTHRKGCTGEPRSKQIADLTGRVAPLTDAEIVWFRAWKEALPNTGSFWASVEDADRTVDARKEPKP